MKKIAKLKWRFAGHVARLNDDRWTKRLLQWRPREDGRMGRRYTQNGTQLDSTCAK